MTLIMRDLENREIGIEEGRSQRDREIVEKMLKKGKTVEEIVVYVIFLQSLLSQCRKAFLYRNKNLIFLQIKTLIGSLTGKGFLCCNLICKHIF
ncbi:MAG: hypothetical protein IJ141_00160 [Lachnospiraceae bacterium]|nr:hypothetical protein [Lachnospiraceae bacterium]